MNYGFNPTPFDSELHDAMLGVVLSLPPDKRGMHPYIERDGLYEGVRIRRITHYSDEMIDKIVRTCEEAYTKTEKEYESKVKV